MPGVTRQPTTNVAARGEPTTLLEIAGYATRCWIPSRSKTFLAWWWSRRAMSFRQRLKRSFAALGRGRDLWETCSRIEDSRVYHVSGTWLAKGCRLPNVLSNPGFALGHYM